MVKNYCGFTLPHRLVDKLLMVCHSEIVELWLCRNDSGLRIEYCSREITALVQTAGCQLLLPINWERSRESSNLMGPAVSLEYRGNRGEIRNRVGMLSLRQTF